MAITKQQLAHEWHNARDRAIATDATFDRGMEAAYRKTLIIALSRQERAIVSALTMSPSGKDTDTLARRCKTNVRAINGTLKRLMSYGLVMRDKVVTEAGRFFVYRLA